MMQNLIDQFKHHKPQLFLIAGLIALGVILVWLTRQPVVQLQTKTRALVEVELTPTQLDLTTGQTTTLEVKLAPVSQSETISLDAADIFLNFDSEVIEIEKMEKATLFSTYPLLTIQGGVIKISGLAWDQEAAQKVSLSKAEVLAMITVKTKKTGITEILLAEDSVVAQNGVNILDLQKETKAVIRVIQ